MEIEVDLINGELKLEAIDIYELFENMSEEDKDKLAEMFTWDRILKAAIKRLTGESMDSADSDDKLTLEVLTKMEIHLLSGYTWSILRNLDALAQNMITHEHIYWLMYHEQSEGFGMTFHDWLNEHKIESNYTSKCPSYVEFREFVEKKLDEFGNQLCEVGDDKVLLSSIADQLKVWISETEEGAWSTHLVKHMMELSEKIVAHLGGHPLEEK